MKISSNKYIINNLYIKCRDVYICKCIDHIITTRRDDFFTTKFSEPSTHLFIYFFSPDTKANNINI